MKLHAFTIRASWLGRVHPLYSGNVTLNAIREIAATHGWVAYRWDTLPCGGVRVVRS
jgi:hypothetical protein